MDDRGPADTFEITWTGGHVERIRAHQVSYPGQLHLGSGDGQEQIAFHSEVDGHWGLVLQVLVADIRTIRNLTRTEVELTEARGGAPMNDLQAWYDYLDTLTPEDRIRAASCMVGALSVSSTVPAWDSALAITRAYIAGRAAAEDAGVTA